MDEDDYNKSSFLDHLGYLDDEVLAAEILIVSRDDYSRSTIYLYKNYTEDEYQEFLDNLKYQYRDCDNYIWFKSGAISRLDDHGNWRYGFTPSVPSQEPKLHKLIIGLKTFSNGRLCPYELLEVIELKSISKRYGSKYLLDCLL